MMIKSSLFVGADDPARSGFFPSHLREKAPAEKIRTGKIHLPSKRLHYVVAAQLAIYYPHRR
jgi:hypothetical protein